MKKPISLTVLTLLLAVCSLSAATHYVSLGSTNPTPPYTNWVTAATSIQAAVNVAATNDVVLVTNGVYPGSVSVTKALMLLSVNGPQFTIINGGGTNRCVDLTDGASLTGFTLTNGYTGDWGGGVEYASTNAFLTNCLIVGNLANNGGGGAYGCTLYNCTLSGNSAPQGSGGGAYRSTLCNCTLSGNSAADYDDGGVYSCTLYNCIIYYNTAAEGANYDSSSTLNYCCTTPLPTTGVGNLALDPQLASASHLSAGSPCRGAGSAAYATGTDIDGEPWRNPPSIGCDEYHVGAVTGSLTVGLVASATNVLVRYAVSLTALIEGRTTQSVWDFGDGVVVSNRPYASHAWAAPGDYAVALRAYNEANVAGVSATLAIHVVPQPVLYVAATSPNPRPPYASWATAATNIQDAVNAAELAGAAVLVTNGVYPGGVSVTEPLTLLSVNGPQFTIINGGGPCVYLKDGASLTGFTLRNGHWWGVYCASRNAFLTNCLIVGNSSGIPGSGWGGGANGGTLYNCTLRGNTAWHNGLGGGACFCTLYNCTLTGNSADVFGYLPDSASSGGGACFCTLYNCTLSGNSASYGGGADGCTLYNCIVYYNTASAGANYDSSSTLNYCCTTPLPTTGVGNITSAPLFVDYTNGNLRLQSNSPCINAGNNAYVATTTDLDGRPRLVGGTVDMGAYEFQPGVSGAFIGWLQQYGLPTDGSADYADPDRDGLNNWQEWVCGTCPTNGQSVLRMVTAVPTASNATVTWQSVAGVSYLLERSANPAAPFTLLATNIVGQAGTTSYGDTNAAGKGPFFYRVGVECP
jgi:hypothetical protein